MLNVDRHIALQAGWIAGPAFGLAMMAAPDYLKLSPPYSAFLFWAGIAVFLLTILVVAFLSACEEGNKKRLLQPTLIVGAVMLIFGGPAAWYFWPQKAIPAVHHVDGQEKNFLLNDKLQSKASKYIFSCNVPPPAHKVSVKDQLSRSKGELDARGDALGLTIETAEIPHGVKMEITPKTPETIIRAGGVSRVVYEIRRAGLQLLVTMSMDIPDPLGLIMRLMPVDPNSETSVALKKQTEIIVGAEEGACQIL
ncbi:hypothetical protein [Methyloferula stellata]|uniref:hypothetical protein n=1 Tax=Methyloferula stellata TaxID=876270 RepID=UPI0003826AB7|nr:hypothetical protein [Methyloferula stellata]